MAARTLVITTPSLTGTSVVSASSALASSDTCVLSPSTAQSQIDMSSLVMRLTNANTITSVLISIAAGSQYSGIKQGVASFTIATADTTIVGGQGFESARFLNATGGTITLTATGTGPTSIEAYQSPRANE
jgi:hypothetical protein